MSQGSRGYFAGNIKTITALTRTVNQRNKLIMNFEKNIYRVGLLKTLQAGDADLRF